MIKLILIFLLYTGNCSEMDNYKFKVTVSSDIIGTPILFSVFNDDTLRVQSKNDSIFYIKKKYIGNKLLIKFDTVLFDVGKLDRVAKSIHLNYTKSIGEGCFVLNKIYNDVIQTQFDKELNCLKFNEIFIYDVTDPIKEPQAVKIRRKEL